MKSITQLITIFTLFISLTALSAPIKSIHISGLNAISRGTVLSYLPVEVGDDYNTKISGDIIRRLYETDFFKDIEVSQDAQILTIKIIENPHIKYVDVINYSSKIIEKEVLDKILKDMSLSQGKIFSKKQLNKFIAQLKFTYTSKGYYDINIKEKIEIDAQNRVGIELDVTEGEVAKIKTMTITGGKIYKEEDLLSLFEIGEADFVLINYFTEKDHYSKVALDAGIEALKSKYINAGYLDFTVDTIKTDLTEDKQSIDIAIQINEGSEYNIGVINFSGDLINQSIKQLKALFKLKQGDIFERKRVVEGIQTITDIFADQGHAFASISPSTTENKQTHAIDLNIDVKLNQKVYINRITISGNTRTQDEVIRREIGVTEGGLYSNTELDESIKKIKRLGFFSDVKMEVSKLKGIKDKINLHFTVAETKTGQFSIGVSHSNNTGTAFNLGIKENNFLGTGNILNAQFSNSKAVKEASFYFKNPYFTEDKHSISYGIFTKSVDGAELDVSSYEIDENGLSLGYGIPLTKDTRIGAEIRASKRNITCGMTFSDSAHEQEQCASNDETEVKTSINWSNNTLDSFNFPTEGQTNKISLDVTLPIADFRYYKINIAHKSYYPINNDGLTFKVKGSVGLGGGYDGKELPFFKRYYGGGSSSVRGFDFNSLGATYSDGKAKGGELSLLAGTSIVSKVKFISSSDNMRISAFIDAGSISETTSNMDDLRLSVGLAFNWLTPIGPLGFYAAKPLIKKSGDKTKTFDFTLGTNF